jgi:hypothetical protein
METLSNQEEDYLLESELENWRNSKRYKEDHENTDAQLGGQYWSNGL